MDTRRHGSRLGYDEVPERVRAAIADVLGAPVVAARSQPLGFSPGLAADLTPSPIDAPPIADLDAAMFRGWRTLASDPAAAEPLGPWVGERLDELAAIEATWIGAAEGGSLVHCDLRADNILLVPDRVVFVDWPHARIGAPWLDLLFMRPSATATGTDPEPVWAGFPPARTAAPEAMTAVLVALTGFFLHGSLQPPPRNLPRLWELQRTQGEAALRWLRRRRHPLFS